NLSTTTMSSTLSLHDALPIFELGRRLAELAHPGDVIALSGPLGAGKTSIARGLLAALGLAGEAPSPSFAIVQPYDPPEVRFPVRSEEHTSELQSRRDLVCRLL